MKRGLFLLLVVGSIFLFQGKLAQAATAAIELATEEKTVRVDEEFIVTLTIRTTPADGESVQDAVIGDFEGFMVYDSEFCEFITAPACITGGDGMIRIADIGAYASENGERTYTMRFRALARGEAQFSMYTAPLVYVFGRQDAMSVSHNMLDVTVEAAKDASDNANLSALRVNPGKLSPAFGTTVREYEVTIPYESESIIISALTEDTSARVSVNGSTGLTVGRNSVIVTVTAENGDEKRYYLTVIREAFVEPTEEPPVVPASAPSLEEGIHASIRDNGTFLTVGSHFVVSDDETAYIAPTGYEETILYLDGIQVKAYKKRDEIETQFFVLVLRDEAGKSGYYSYDREGQTIQRFHEDRIEFKQVVESDTSGFEKTIRSYKNRQVLLLLLLAMFVAFCALLLLIVLRGIRKRHTDDEDTFDDGFR